MEQHINGKVVAITGGFGHLGVATAAWLGARGARVALIGRGAAPDANALPDVPATALRLGGIDLVDPQAAVHALDAVHRQFGGVDALLNIAGAFVWQTIADGDVDTWDRMYALNVKTALNASKAALPYLLQSAAGRIVNIGAGAASKAGTGMGAYAAAKAGVARLTEALAAELLDRGITVNAVLPSIIDTPSNRADMPDADFTRWVQPQQIAATIDFCCRPKRRPSRAPRFRSAGASRNDCARGGTPMRAACAARHSWIRKRSRFFTSLIQPGARPRPVHVSPSSGCGTSARTAWRPCFCRRAAVRKSVPT